MSDGMNRVMLLGNLGHEPELRYGESGVAYLRLRLATTETFLDKDKQRQERTEWHTVVVFGTRAEALAKILAKGSCVLIEGGLRTSSYEKDGVKLYKTEVHARDVFLTGRRAAGHVSVGAQADDNAQRPSGPRNGGPAKPLFADAPLEDVPF